MSKHTPAPWYWDSDPIKGDPLGRVRFRVVARGKTITQCYYSSGDEQSEWDARLIAAAPNLKFQLLAAANYVDALGGDSRAYRQAIAEAEGE
jgi:hypothetical protein